MINMREHKQAQRTLRLAKKTSLELPSSELAYQVRLASKRLHQDRLASRRLVSKTSLAEDKETNSLEGEPSIE